MKLYPLTYLALAALAVTGCKNDDTDFNLDTPEEKDAPMEIAFSDAPLSESDDPVPDPADEAYNDYIESFKASAEISIVFKGSTVEVDNPSSSVSVTATGAHVTANIGTKAVRFNVTGSSDDASLKVLGDNRFCIALNNVTLSNPAGAVINNQSKKTLYIDCPEGTVNTLTSVGAPAGDSDAKGCLFSEGQMAFSGKGRLTVKSAFRNGIASDDYIFVRPGCLLDVTSTAGNGVKANDGVTINGGILNILVDYNGGKGINSESFVTVNGGRTTVINRGTTRLDRVEVSDLYPQGVDTVSCAGVKSDGDLRVMAGQLLVKCEGADSKGIKTNGAYVQTGGDVAVVTLGAKNLASPKGIKADASLTVSGGILYVYSAHAAPLDSDGPVSVYHYKTQKPYLIEVGN